MALLWYLKKILQIALTQNGPQSQLMNAAVAIDGGGWNKALLCSASPSGHCQRALLRPTNGCWGPSWPGCFQAGPHGAQHRLWSPAPAWSVPWATLALGGRAGTAFGSHKGDCALHRGRPPGGPGLVSPISGHTWVGSVAAGWTDQSKDSGRSHQRGTRRMKPFAARIKGILWHPPLTMCRCTAASSPAAPVLSQQYPSALRTTALGC